MASSNQRPYGLLQAMRDNIRTRIHHELPEVGVSSRLSSNWAQPFRYSCYYPLYSNDPEAD